VPVLPTVYCPRQGTLSARWFVRSGGRTKPDPSQLSGYHPDGCLASLGKEQDLTKVIVNQQISKLAFQLTLNVRNKVLSAYKDIMNMPV